MIDEQIIFYKRLDAREIDRLIDPPDIRSRSLVDIVAAYMRNRGDDDVATIVEKATIQIVNKDASQDVMNALADLVASYDDPDPEIEEPYSQSAFDFLARTLGIVTTPSKPKHEVNTLELVEGGIRIRDEIIALKPKALQLLSLFIDARGEYVSMADAGFRRRDIANLPEKVQAIIDTQPGAGTRIFPRWFN